MKSRFSFTLYNSPFEDSILYARQLNVKEDILFDLGDISNAPSSHLLRVKRIFISHTHMDHFCGFHNFFRTVLKLMGKEIEIYGPTNIIENVYGALTSYTWNLIKEFDITFLVTEVSEKGLKKAALKSQHVFEPEILSTTPLKDTVIVDDPFYTVRVDFFDHKTPVLGFRLDEKDQYAVNKKALEENCLESGSWIVEAKQLLLEGKPLDYTVLTNKGEIAIGEIQKELFLPKEPAAFAYLTDFGMTKENFSRAVDLAQNVYTLYIESNFLHKDITLAKAAGHLTAYQAGIIAGKANAEHIRLFHFSQRYSKIEQVHENVFYEEMEQGRSYFVSKGVPYKI
ncbi:MAG: hypothetical protein GY754_33785 [bacterium]|nr:hypothetical protein [bacterium]